MFNQEEANVAELFVETNELSFPGDTIEDHFSLDEQVVVDTWEACVRGGHEADEILEALEDRRTVGKLIVEP